MRSDFGYDDARGFGDRHENFSENPKLEKAMDLRNNAVGLGVAYKGETSYTEVRNACKTKANGNYLWTIKNGKLV